MTHTDHFDRIHREYLAADASAAWLFCDRHDPDTVALTVVSEEGVQRVTFGELRAASNRFAHALRARGVGPGTRVATLLRKGPELIITMLAVWRLGGVYVPLFTAFAEKAIEYRVTTADARVIITDPVQRPKLAAHFLTGVDVVMVDGDGEEGDLSYEQLMEGASGQPLDSHIQGPEGPLVHIFTSGTTGSPKGVIHPLRHVAGWHSYLVYGLGVTDEDVYWSAADPGWAYGLYTAGIAPLANGTPTILQREGFDPARAWRLIENQGVTNFAAAPTVYRAIRTTVTPDTSRVRLRRLSSAGEPLTPEINTWAAEALGTLVHDHFGQTEVGMVFGNAHHPAIARPVVPGSMGYPLPGWKTTVLDEHDQIIDTPGEVGRIVIETDSPAMTFRTYQDPSRTGSRFAGDGRFYLLGDLGYRDGTGAVHFASRDDDIILMAGYRIGPFEIESVLSEHPAVAESAAIGAPDADRGEVLEAFVVLRDGWDPSPDLAAELQTFVKERYAAHAYPRRVHFAASLPKTPSGKIQRFMLRDQRRAEHEKAQA